MFLEPGGIVTVRDLLKGIIVQSGNDACIVVAENISGDEESFADLMNEKAAEMNYDIVILQILLVGLIMIII